MNTIFTLNDVFTPSRPARVTFVDRDKINSRIVRALQIPGTQIVIYGHTGSGKTTLLENKLFQTYEKHIRTNCMKGMTFEQILLDAFDQLGEFYLDEITNKRKLTIDASAKAAYLDIKLKLGASAEEEEATKKKRVIPPQLTPQSLARLMGQAGYCWVLEDFHKMEEKYKENLSQMMKVFMDMSDKYPDLKIIALGAVNTAREVVQYDKEMKKRVAEIHVEPMSSDEIKEIIKKGCIALNIIIDKGLSEDIAHHSNGLASICHKICYILCDHENIRSTLEHPLKFDQADLQHALSEYISDESDTIKCSFDKALKLKGAEDILWALAKINGDGASVESIFDHIKNNLHSKSTVEKAKEVLDQLGTESYGESIKFDLDSARYSFADPFLGAFALAYFEEKEKSLTKKRLTAQETAELLNNTLRMFMQSHAQTQKQFSVGDSSDEPLTDGRE